MGHCLEEVEKRDLSLTNPLDPEKADVLNEVRDSEIVRTDGVFHIPDIVSTEHTIIDSLEKVKQVQDEVLKMGVMSSSVNHTHLNDLSFLLKWNTMDFEEKNKNFSKQCCHEVNLFIYIKDPEYF